MFETNGEAELERKQYSRRFFLLSGGVAAGGLVLAAAGWRSATPVAAEAKPSGPPAMVTIVPFTDAGERQPAVKVPKIVKTEAEWKQLLPKNSYQITRLADTEMAYTGATWNLHDKGLFRCICCDTALFSSATKFDSGTGWPSFWEPIAKENIEELSDSTLGMERTAVSCKRCDAHLGHVFDDGPQPTGLRYCMNSGAMKFVKMA